MRHHASDCATNNPPALPAGPCSCGYVHVENIDDYTDQLRDGDIDLEEFVTDVATELRHICDLGKLDFGALDRRAYGHYCVEAAHRLKERT